MGPAELRRRREALHLTQAALGQAIGVARNTIARWERGEVSIQHPAFLAAVLDQLAAGPARVRDAQRPAQGGGRAGNLPAELTSFIGREQLLADVAELLRPESSACRLLTMTGSGGTGKTRFALRVASELRQQFEDGVWFVSLAPISDPNLVASTIAQTLGVAIDGSGQPLEGLKSYLGSRQVLLVLDNFEQVLGAAYQIPELLAACPRVQVVVTSRAALQVSGEREITVPPLKQPVVSQAWPARSDPRAEVEECESVRLFVERAHAVNGDFALTGVTAPAVAEICLRLDGLPLAIELAAARMRLLDAPAVLERLKHRLPFLTGGARDVPARQQTLHNTIAWSYDLLEPPEQAFFRTVSVFVGGATLEAAQAVSLREVDSLDTADSLVAKSLLGSAIASPGETRLTVLETTREFGLEQAARSGELEALRCAHARYFVSLAEQAEAPLWGPAASSWLDRLERDHDNMRAALEWSLAGGGEGGYADISLRLAGALSRFWWTRSYFEEGSQWLARALAVTSARTPERMKALHGAGWLAHFRQDSATARALLEESLTIARELHDEWAEAWVLHCLGRVAYFGGDHVRARGLGEQSLRVADRLGDQWLIAWALHLLGLAAHIAGDYTAADAFYERSLAIRQVLGHHEAIGVLYQLMGISAHRQGNFARARELCQEFLTIGRELGSPWHRSNVLAQFASLAAAQQQPDRAARLIGAAAALSETFRTRPIPLIEALLAESVDQARRALGEEAFARAVAEGRVLSTEDAIAEALNVELAESGGPLGPPGAPGAIRGHATRVVQTPSRVRRARPDVGLTRREEEVAALVARGLTNRQIAEELVIAEGTAGVHLEHILTKLGLHSRTQLALWAADRARPSSPSN